MINAYFILLNFLCSLKESYKEREPRRKNITILFPSGQRGKLFLLRPNQNSINPPALLYLATLTRARIAIFHALRGHQTHQPTMERLIKLQAAPEPVSNFFSG
jgi:hypothetical protein